MKQLIKIDKNSIYKNKNVGETSTTIKGNQTITFSGSGKLPDLLVDELNCHLTAIEYGDNDEIVNYSGVMHHIDDDLYKNLKEQSTSSFKINIKLNNNIIHHEPIPKYSYRFDEHTIITCDYCNEELTYDQLLEYDDYDYYNDKVCPHCGEHDCVDLVFENINDVI